jgi:hypothetical protein
VSVHFLCLRQFFQIITSSNKQGSSLSSHGLEYVIRISSLSRKGSLPGISETIVCPSRLLFYPFAHLFEALVVVYSYHPNSQTLAEVYLKGTNSSASTPTSSTPPPVPGGRQPHFKPKPGQIGAFAQPRYTNRIPERTLWSFIVQIANATKAVHDAGMAVRVLDSTKILVTGKNRCGDLMFLLAFISSFASFKRPDLVVRHCRRAYARCTPGARRPHAPARRSRRVRSPHNHALLCQSAFGQQPTEGNGNHRAALFIRCQERRIVPHHQAHSA